MSKLRFLPLALACMSVLSIAPLNAGTIIEDFSIDPLQNGWNTFGQANLFQWDSTNHNLRVTWDSSQPNSYFYHSLDTILTRDDDFSLAFDMRLDDIGPGPNTNKPSTFPIAVGFLNLDGATQTNFVRGT